MISSTVSGSERFTRRRTGKDVFGAFRVSFLDAISFCCKLHPLQVEITPIFAPPKVFPSHFIFLMCISMFSRRVDGKDALQVKEKLASHGIIVRHYTKPESISGCIRVSVGRPEHTEALCKALDKI